MTRTSGSVLIAVSRSADPTAGWSAISVPASSTGACWFDFPMLGIDADSIFISVRRVEVDPSVPCADRVAIIVPKADLLADARLIPTVTTIGDDTAQDPNDVPLQTPLSVPDNATQEVQEVARTPLIDPLAPTSDVGVTKLLGLTSKKAQPMVDLDSGSGLGDYLSVDDVDTFRRWETIVSGPVLFIFDTAIQVEPHAQALLGRQPPPKASVEIPLDQSFRSSIIRRTGTFWGTHTVSVPPTLDVAVRWFQIDAATNLVIQEGIVAQAGMDFYYPSIAVNDMGDVVIGFNGSSPTQFIGSYAVLGQTLGGVTTFGSPVLLQTGLDGYEVIGTGNRNRWGDYSATVVDPVNPDTFWTFQEYVSAEDVWSTRITELTVSFDEDEDEDEDEDCRPETN